MHNTMMWASCERGGEMNQHDSSRTPVVRCIEWVIYLIVTGTMAAGMHWAASLPADAQAELWFGTSTWLVIWAALGIWVVAFIYMERCYPRLYVALSVASYLLSWGWQGLRLSGWVGARSMWIDMADMLISLLSLVVLAVAIGKGEQAVRHPDR